MDWSFFKRLCKDDLLQQEAQTERKIAGIKAIKELAENDTEVDFCDRQLSVQQGKLDAVRDALKDK